MHPEFLRSAQSTGERFTSMITGRATVWAIAGVVAAAVGLLVLSARLAPESEQAYRVRPSTDPLLPARTSVNTPEREVRALLYFERESALRGDVDGAMQLWSERGRVRDARYTPNDPTDDSVWVGLDQVRARYMTEFARHDYVSLRHRDASVVIEGDRAVVVNDLQATLRTPRGLQQVYLARGDRWTFEKENGEWRLVSLEVNRTPR